MRFPGCTKRKSNILTFDLKRTDYLETIDAIGTIQAVNNIILVTPRINVSNITVVHLAEEGSYVKKEDTVFVMAACSIE